jgi:hypothetical protein
MNEKDKPIEVYCPICGFREDINSDDDRLRGLSREKKIAKIRELQGSAAPFFTCDGCRDGVESAKILEIR